MLFGGAIMIALLILLAAPDASARSDRHMHPADTPVAGTPVSTFSPTPAVPAATTIPTVTTVPTVAPTTAPTPAPTPIPTTGTVTTGTPTTGTPTPGGTP